MEVEELEASSSGNLTLGYLNLKSSLPKSVRKQNLVRNTQSCKEEGSQLEGMEGWRVRQQKQVSLRFGHYKERVFFFGHLRDSSSQYSFIYTKNFSC